MDNLIDGKAVAATVRAGVAERTKKLLEETGVRAGLAVIIVGDVLASEGFADSYLYSSNRPRGDKSRGDRH